MRGRPGGLTLELFPKPAVALSPGGQRQRELALVATAADAGCLVQTGDQRGYGQERGEGHS